jgi:hypothetical protein
MKKSLDLGGGALTKQAEGLINCSLEYSLHKRAERKEA